jgi:hypothetical protein
MEKSHQFKIHQFKIHQFKIKMFCAIGTPKL